MSYNLESQTKCSAKKMNAKIILDGRSSKNIADSNAHLRKLLAEPTGHPPSIRIPTTQGLFAVVDIEDGLLVSRFKWHVRKTSKLSKNTYAGTTLPNGKNTTMHRLILDPPSGIFIDHIDHDGLNNRRSNLRIATHSQNMGNKRKQRGTSKYKGVSFVTRKGQWGSQIGIRGKCIWLGYFRIEEEAALAYNKAAVKHFGEFALINKISSLGLVRPTVLGGPLT